MHTSLPSPLGFVPNVGTADGESLRQESHLLPYPLEEMSYRALCPPFLPQVTLIGRNSMNMNGTAEKLTRKPRARSDLVTELGEGSWKKTQSILPNVHSPWQLISPTHSFPQIFTYLASSLGTQWALTSFNAEDILLKKVFCGDVCTLLFWERQKSGQGYRMAI